MIITKAEAGHVYDIDRVRADFPILARPVRGRPLVYLDNSASAQKPQVVIDAESFVYETEYANINRGLYYLSERATERYEASRRTVQHFINAKHSREVIFTRNTTESINLVAASYGRRFLQPGDEIIISGLEHHSNIVPWQLLRDERGIVIKVVPVADNGEVSAEAVAALLGPRTKLVSVAHVSNVLGTILPVADIIRQAHAVGAKVLIDGAQAVMHLPVDVQELDADFYAFSSHKIYGPTGVGVLYGKEELLNAMPPYQGGGDMIHTVTFEKSTWAELPAKFEAGTPAIAQVAALATAIDYVSKLGLAAIAAHEADLLAYATQSLQEIPGLRIFGTVPHKAAVVSFALESAHPHDIAQVLDNSGVAIRAGHHCAQPLMERFDVPALARASFGLYNTRAEVDALVAAVRKVEELFGQ
ncbi:cysteine desulfurase [Telmatospirillum sp.]|uniref:aminotransferase class V-fold PLP-dependent enzyme n=1 Tax=Telmatospirillum sp. TaxID=2079197 RepID=UPI002846F852|nr:cysteine desulfurase [Telmatospirillum sp.]MDR3440475.1 cysteine desulfurase [Telmatospirillum sp.]